MMVIIKRLLQYIFYKVINKFKIDFNKKQKEKKGIYIYIKH
jgi:hypothetical protein